EGQSRRRGVDDVGRVAVLHGLTVDAGSDTQSVGEAADFRSRDDGTEWARAVTVLPECPLSSEFLRDPRGDIVEGRVSYDRGLTCVLVGISERSTEVRHDRALPIEASFVCRHGNLSTVDTETASPASEERRMLWKRLFLEAAFCVMSTIVQSDAD